ncbi:DUF5988 family protein [Streptomyces sp. KLMMK]|uniref:DUF5988 family protein n=1 Tax=Streptomyces sp. KLMMK TaxID=3109353 RepID=UPI003009724F
MHMETVDGSGQWVVLEGLPRLYRMVNGQCVDPTRLVVAFYGQHQHFEDTGEMELVEGRLVPVFRFSYSTKIAE